MYAIYMVTFTINIPPMLAYIPYMDPMGNIFQPIVIIDIMRIPGGWHFENILPARDPLAHRSYDKKDRGMPMTGWSS
jgi:hypothetical protein